MTSGRVALAGVVVVLLELPAVAQAQGGANAKADAAAFHHPSGPDKPVKVPEGWRWEPPWRERGDCGPVCLFVLARLQRRHVSIILLRIRWQWLERRRKSGRYAPAPGRP